MITPTSIQHTIGEYSVSSPEPRELASPVQIGKDFRATVDRDFSARVVRADDVNVEQVAVPKAPVSSATEPVSSQISADSTDSIPPPEDLSAPVEPGPSQLPTEEESLPDSTAKTNPGVSKPPALTPTPNSSSRSAAK